MGKVTVDVIIPTLDKNIEYLNLCLNSLAANTTTFEPVISIARNGEGTGYPQGQCAAVNREAAKGASEWIMVTNDDMVFVPGWDVHSNFKKTVCWSPNLIEPMGQDSAAPFLKLAAGNDLRNFKLDEVKEFIDGYNQSVRIEQQLVTWEIGFNLPFFIRRDLWETIGGYDIYYDPWGSNSDTDLQTKIELAGVTPMRNRNCLVYHFGSKSETFTADKQEFWNQNWNYYKDKWGYTRDDEPKGDPWYCQNMLNKDKLIYHPEWEGKYT